jgi:quercetin dioxygenase-like cupin family protein
METDATPQALSLLGGQVRKQVLPCFQGAPGDQAPPVKRLLLGQGELAQLLDGEQCVRYLAFIELRSGAVRGNHFHKVKQEFIYIIHGRAELRVEDTRSKAQDSMGMEPGDLVFVAAGIAHRVDVLEPGQAIEFSEAPFDAGDIYSYPLNAFGVGLSKS